MSLVIVIILILVVLAILAVITMSMYNGFVRERNKIQESWRQVDVELNRRYELLPNLVETVRAYAAHERNTLDDITRLRGQAQSLSQSQGQASPERAQIEDQLSGAVRGLMVNVEAYPDLKSNTNFLELQRQLAETEDRIANGRRFYNANVRAYNTRVESVPSNIIAGMFHFEKATYFEVTDPAARTAPAVNFGEIAYRGDEQSGQLPPAQPPAQQPYAPGNFQQPAPGSFQQPAPGSFQQAPQQQAPQQQAPQQPVPQQQAPQQQAPQQQAPQQQIPQQTGPQQPPQQPPYQQPPYQQPPQG